MRREDQKTIKIKDFAGVELNVQEQKQVKGGDDEIVVEEDVVN